MTRLAIPVRKEHNHDFQPVELLGAQERVLVIGPALLIAQFLDGFILLFEPRVGEGAVGPDVLFGSIQVPYAGYASAGDEVAWLDEIADLPYHPRSKDLGVDLFAPLDSPNHTARVPCFDLGIGSARVLTDEGEGRFGRGRRSAFAPGKVEPRHIARV